MPNLKLIIGTETFNSIAGVTVSLPRTVSSVDHYSVGIVPVEDSGFIGDIWVEKDTTGFTVYNSGSEDATDFEYQLFYR
jgi:hypothetical protein